MVGERADGDADEAGIEFHEPVNGSAEMGMVASGERLLGVTLASMGAGHAYGAERIIREVSGQDTPKGVRWCSAVAPSNGL